MLRRPWLFFFLLTALAGGVAYAAQPVDQGQGSPNVLPWRVNLVGASVGTGKPAALTTGAPLVRVAISAVSADSGAVLVPGNSYRIACSTDCFLRWGAGAQTALTTDSAFFGPAVEYLTAPAGATNVAFITVSGTGFCTITTVVP